MSNLFIKTKKKLISNNIKPKQFKDFFFCWITNVNKNEYLINRNKIRIRKNLKSTKKIKISQHNNFIKNYKKLNRIDFVIVNKKKKIVGGVNLKKTIFGYEIGKFISHKKYLNKGIAKKAVIIFILYIKKFFNIKKIFSYTNKNNLRNIILNLKLGFEISKLDKKFLLMSKKIK